MPCGSSKDACNQDKNGTNGHCAFEDLDHAVLQQPLNLGVTNIKQILKCVQSGSREVKDIILNECNIIYECKACVGLFRSLANFMYHKRCYCKKHMCEDMLLFENFDEEEIITIQPEAPKEKISITEESTNMSDSIMDVDKSEVSESPCSSKDKNTVAGASKGKAKENPENTMISKRTRDKKAQNRVSVKITAPEEPPLKCAKIVSEEIETKIPDTSESNVSDKLDASGESDKNVKEEPDKSMIEEPDKNVNEESGKNGNEEADKNANEEADKMPSKLSVDKSSGEKANSKQSTSAKEIKTKKIEFSKISGMLEKSMPSFPKIIFKTIDSNQNAVFQSDDKKKLETFGLGKKFQSATVETKMDNDKLIIVLKKDVKSDSSSDSKPSESHKQKSHVEKASDFHLTRRKRLMARTDCDVHELKCLVCKTQFMSLKTLYFHMLSLHSKKRLYYPCPFCKTLFVQMYGVTRHLVAIHNKSRDQINKLREVIKKKSVWKKIDDSNPAYDSNISPLNYQIKEVSPPPEVKTEPPKDTESESSDTTDSSKTDIKISKNVTLHRCTKCNRAFGRKSSQVSHEKFCIMNSPVKTERGDDPPVVQPNLPTVTQPTPRQPVSQPAPRQPVTQHVPKQPVVSFLSPPSKSPVSKTISKPASVVQIKPINTPVVQKPVSDTKISVRPKRGAEKQMHKDFVNSQTLKWRSANRVDTNANISKTPPSVKTHSVKSPTVKKIQKDGKNLEKKVLNFMNAENLTCLKCDKKFSSYSNLRRHVAIHVGWTRFKCKFCDYQAYNKSQCWAHVQKSHSVDESEMDKSIVNLVNSSASNKKLKKSYPQHAKHSLESTIKTSAKNNAIPKVKISKKKVMGESKVYEKKQLQVQKKESSETKKVEKAHVEANDSKKEKPQTVVPIQKVPKKDTSEAKKEKAQTTDTIEKLQKKEVEKDVKKEKPHHIIPIQKLTIPRETNYKSVTTSNPTTIILSKKIPSTTVQSIVTIASDPVSSTSKISPIRTSPRKMEIKGPGERLITTLVTRSGAYTKATPVQIKLPAKPSSTVELSKDCSKKEKLISEWFPKKDLSSSNVRRESAPLIIGLVPAGLNARVKSSPPPSLENDATTP